MKVVVLEEHGYQSAMLGLSLSRKQDPTRMPAVAQRLAFKGDGHNKFLESIIVWLDITAPRYWWQEFDTYRVAVTKQSESTVYNLLRQPLTQEDFEIPIPHPWLNYLNDLIEHGKEEGNDGLRRAKALLPEGYLQRRIVCLNYLALQRIIRQRENHPLQEWHIFIQEVLAQVEHPELLYRSGRR